VNVGLFGGTFDPPHTGHLIVAQDAALALGLDRILFVPAARPPHKTGTVVSPAPLRLAMLELAVGGDPRFVIDRTELERSGPSFTVDTLRTLAGAWPGTALTLLIGADQYAEFGTWREPDTIRQLARVAVLDRGPGTGGAPGPAPAARPLGDGVVAVSVTRIDVSSTEVRRRVAAGLPIRYLVPAAVEQFIVDHRLYGRNGASVPGYNPGHPE
jgi:nicotinate-nucleotide adenylyltransferase